MSSLPAASSQSRQSARPNSQPNPGQLGQFVLLGLAVAAISSSALLVRWSSAPPLAMAFWRTLAGAILLTPSMMREHRRGPEHAADARNAKQFRSDRWLLLLAGGALGLHFATWLPSLQMTSVAASVTLVSTAPLFVAVMLFALGRFTSRSATSQTNSEATGAINSKTWIAIALAGFGTLVIAFDDLVSDPGSLDGDLLALTGAFATAIYLIAGDRVRKTRSTAAYVAPTYAVASIVILATCLATETSLVGFDTKSWIAILGMILGPQLCGHTVLNYLLGRMGSISISLAFLAEPVFASVLVWVLLSEAPPGGVWLGAPLVLVGLGLQIMQRSQESNESAT